MKKLLFLLFLFSGFGTAVAQTIEGYEYWFDEDFLNKQTVVVSPQETVTVSMVVSTVLLAPGAHIISFRFFDDQGTYSSVISSHFYKPHENVQAVEKTMVDHEYWFDDDIANRVITSVGNQEVVNLSLEISTSNLPDGIHILNQRFKDSQGQYTTVISQFAYKVPVSNMLVANRIQAFRYWINDDFANVKDSLMAMPLSNFILLDEIALSQLPQGNYTINFQFKDQEGQWSPVSSTEIGKELLPLANFSFSKDELCDSTTYTFSNLSIDADSYLWDFGDGETSTDFEPQHTYNQAGVYQVSLLATDSNTGDDSLKTISINVKGHTAANLTMVSCGPYTSPSGLYTWNNTGVYNDTLSNHYGCDSVLTIDLTVNPVVTLNSPVANSNYRCGPGSVNLSATGCSGVYNWFESSTSESILATAASFNTPSISQSTTYYVACNVGACLSAKVPVVATVNVNIVHPIGSLAAGSYSSSESIKSRATVGTPTTYKSGGSILLEPGFKADSGTVFKAEIESCQD